MPNTIARSEYGPSSATALEDGYVGDEKTRNPRPETGGDRLREGDAYWLRLIRDAYDKSRNWFDSSVRRSVENATNAFNNKHSAGSKYHTAAFDKRTKLFRPRTRANVRKLEASLAVATFSTTDVVSVEPTNKADSLNAAQAKVKEAVLRRVLNEPNVHWFQTVLGAFQAAAKEKVVVSHQHWEYKEDRSGNVIHDRPRCDLIPIEQFRMDPASDWRDPINTSPYLIHIKPMYVHEVEALMEADSRTGKARYRQLSREQLLAGVKQDWDSIRNAREGHREDRYERDNQIGEFQTIWVHSHIIHVDGQDYVLDSVGTEHLLMDPTPIEEVYFHSRTGDRPYSLGCSIIETFKPYPNSIVDLGMPIQEEINDIANLTMDTLKLNTSKRYFVRRGGAIDVQTMLRNVPGSLIFTNDPANDVREELNKPVNNSTFQERDRLNTEMDDLTGTFTGSTVGMQRKMNETVGGMNLINEDQNQVQELTLRTFVETWMEPSLRQLMDMVTIYLSDGELLEEVGAENQGTMEDAYEALFAKATTTVNVGFGNTNPAKRMEKLRLAMASIGEVMPDMLNQLDAREFVSEIMGAAGYKDGARFFPSLGEGDQDPMVTQLQEQVAQLQQEVEMQYGKQQAQIEIAQIRAQSAEAIAQINQQGQMGLLQAKQQFDRFVQENQSRLKMLDVRIAAAKEEREKQNLRNQREALSHSISLAEREFALKIYQMFNAPQGEEGQPGEGGQPPIEGESQPVQTLQGTGGPPNEFAMIPPSSRNLITSLRQPPESIPLDIPGEDKAGVLARNEYGAVPFEGG